MLTVKFDDGELRALSARKLQKGFARSARRATRTSARDMRAETVKRVRRKLAIKVKPLKKAIHVQPNKGRKLDDMEWGVGIGNDVMRASNYAYTKNRKGVSVKIRKGSKTLFKGAFIARMKSGKKGVFRRRGKERLPIFEPLAKRPIDALSNEADQLDIALRGRRTFVKEFKRLLDRELGKA